MAAAGGTFAAYSLIGAPSVQVAAQVVAEPFSDKGLPVDEDVRLDLPPPCEETAMRAMSAAHAAVSIAAELLSPFADMHELPPMP